MGASLIKDLLSEMVRKIGLKRMAITSSYNYSSKLIIMADHKFDL